MKGDRKGTQQLSQTSQLSGNFEVKMEIEVGASDVIR
jgi:hypothetical protein